MKDLFPKFWMILTGCFLFGLTFWAIFFVEEIKNQIPIFAIVGVIITALASVITVTLNNNKAKERELELLIMKEKQKAFVHFYNAYFELMKNVKKGKSNALSDEAESEMIEFKKGLMNWCSEGLIQAYLDYDHDIQESQKRNDASKVLKIGDKLLKEFRKEIGIKDEKKVNIMSIILDAKSREKLT